MNPCHCKKIWNFRVHAIKGNCFFIMINVLLLRVVLCRLQSRQKPHPTFETCSLPWKVCKTFCHKKLLKNGLNNGTMGF